MCVFMHVCISSPQVHATCMRSMCYKCMCMLAEDACLCRKTFAAMHVSVGSLRVCVRVSSYVLAEVSLEKPSNTADLAVKKKKKKSNNLFIGIAQIPLYFLSGVQLLSQLFKSNSSCTLRIIDLSKQPVITLGHQD